MARPTKYDPKYCKMVVEWMSAGYSYETFGPSIGVSKQTVYDWEKVNPEFLDSKKEAFGMCQIFWEKIGLAHLVNEYQGATLNTTNWIFNMKNRFGWADRKEIDHTITEISINVDADDDEL